MRKTNNLLIREVAPLTSKKTSDPARQTKSSLANS